MGKVVSLFMVIYRLNRQPSPHQSLHFPPLRKRPFYQCTVNTGFQETSLNNMFLFLCPYFKELLSLYTIPVLVYWVLALFITALLCDNHCEETLAEAGVVWRCSGWVLGGSGTCRCSSGVPAGRPAESAPMGTLVPSRAPGPRTAWAPRCSFCALLVSPEVFYPGWPEYFPQCIFSLVLLVVCQWRSGMDDNKFDLRNENFILWYYCSICGRGSTVAQCAVGVVHQITPHWGCFSHFWQAGWSGVLTGWGFTKTNCPSATDLQCCLQENHLTARDLSLLPHPLFLNLTHCANASRQGRTCRSLCVCQCLAQRCPESS